MIRPLLKAPLQYFSVLNQPCAERHFNRPKIFNVFEILKSVILPNILIFSHSVINRRALSFTLFNETPCYFDIKYILRCQYFFLIISVTIDSVFFVKVYCANIGSKVNFSISLKLRKHNCKDNRKKTHCLKFNVDILYLHKIISGFLINWTKVKKTFFK